MDGLISVNRTELLFENVIHIACVHRLLILFVFIYIFFWILAFFFVFFIVFFMFEDNLLF